MTETLKQLVSRVSGYPLIEVVAELVIIGLVVYGVLRFLRGTRGAGIIKGLGLLLLASTVVVRMLSQGGQHFQRLEYLYNGTLGFLAIALVVIFQPELRRALTRLGEATAIRSTPSEIQAVIDAIVESCRYHAKNKFGALIAIQRHVGLGGLIEGGTKMNAHVTGRLLQSVFWPNNPLHDLGVIIHGNQILAANVQFPLAEHYGVVSHLGSRHRAALGISQETDAIAIVVSEERGTISIAERGQMYFNVSPEHLEQFLIDRLVRVVESNEWARGDTIVRVEAREASQEDEDTPDRGNSNGDVDTHRVHRTSSASPGGNRNDLPQTAAVASSPRSASTDQRATSSAPESAAPVALKGVSGVNKASTSQRDPGAASRSSAGRGQTSTSTSSLSSGAGADAHGQRNAGSQEPIAPLSASIDDPSERRSADA